MQKYHDDEIRNKERTKKIQEMIGVVNKYYSLQ